MNSLRLIRNLKYRSVNAETQIPVSEIRDGANQFDNYFIFKKDGHIKVYDRICNHSGGKLVLRSNNENCAHCPSHGWELSLKHGIYQNNIRKKAIAHTIEDDKIVFNKIERTPYLDANSNKREFAIELINHACLMFRGESFTFAIDPWIIGSTLFTGWWPSLPVRSDWADSLNKCDFIYISHNHEDHFHKQTLSKVRRDMKFYIPRFWSDAMERFLFQLGFRNIEYLEFEKVYSLDRDGDFEFTCLKSGDHRDDSGVYFRYGAFDFLTMIDANLLNGNRLPHKITLFAIALQIGSGEYPLCFDAISDEEKLAIMRRNLDEGLNQVRNYLSIVQPQYFLPYGGFVEAKAPRDEVIRENMIANTPASYEGACIENGVKLCNVDDATIFEFTGSHLEKGYFPSASYIEITEEDIATELSSAKKNFSTIKNDQVLEYFESSNFADQLSLYLSWTSDDFLTVYKTIHVDFSGSKPKANFIDDFNWKKLKTEYDPNLESNRLLYLKVRREILNQLIENSLPWENAASGYQIRFDRIPDVYNQEFWYHFTNQHVYRPL